MTHLRLVPAPPPTRRGWSDRWPVLRPAAIAWFRARRRWQWTFGGVRYAHRRDQHLPVVVKRHKSLLLRRLGDADMWLQHNKVTNLRIAAARLDGLVIEPGETFSFCRTVGRATRRKGYLVGMFLSGGEVRPDVGGGICQAANLLHWMVLHSPLTVTERSEHSFDPFPDSGRVIPWGTGTSIFWNYVDLQVRNDTEAAYQLRVWVGESHLHGELRATAMPPHSYHVEARDERFTRVDGQWWRSNEIWRRVIDRRTGRHLREELVKANRARTLYDPTVTDQDRRPGGRG
jgi:vancomycin resistance protein VanW